MAKFLPYRYDKIYISHPCPSTPKTTKTIHVEVKIDSEGSTALTDVKIAILLACLENFNKNISATARAMGISKRTAQNIINKHNLSDYVSDYSKQFRDDIRRVGSL